MDIALAVTHPIHKPFMFSLESLTLMREQWLGGRIKHLQLVLLLATATQDSPWVPAAMSGANPGLSASLVYIARCEFELEVLQYWWKNCAGDMIIWLYRFVFTADPYNPNWEYTWSLYWDRFLECFVPDLDNRQRTAFAEIGLVARSQFWFVHSHTNAQAA